MLTTRFAGGLRARPLEPRPNRDAGIIWFVTDLQRKGIRNRVRERCRACIHRCKVQRLSLDHGARRNMARRCQGGRNLEVHRQHVVEGTRRSERVRSARHSVDRRVMGWAVEQSRRSVRVRQGATHRRRTEPRRASKGYRRHALMPAAIKRRDALGWVARPQRVLARCSRRPRTAQNPRHSRWVFGHFRRLGLCSLADLRVAAP